MTPRTLGKTSKNLAIFSSGNMVRTHPYTRSHHVTAAKHFICVNHWRGSAPMALFSQLAVQCGVPFRRYPEDAHLKNTLKIRDNSLKEKSTPGLNISLDHCTKMCFLPLIRYPEHEVTSNSLANLSRCNIVRTHPYEHQQCMQIVKHCWVTSID